MDAAGATYLGHVDRHAVPGLVRGHDVVCVLSRSNEPFGLVVLEGMASGCAVIASKRGGLPEACGEAAMLVDESNFSAVTGRVALAGDGSQALAGAEGAVPSRASRQTWGECARILENALLGKCAAMMESAA